MNIDGNPVYEHYNGQILCVNQDVFTKLKLLTYSQFQKWCQRGKLARLRTKGNGRTGLIRWDSIPDSELAKIKSTYGDPYKKDDVKSFINRLENDEEAALILSKAQLSQEKEYQYYIEAQILNLYGDLLRDIEIKKSRNPGFKKTAEKKNIAKVIAELKTVTIEGTDNKRFPHKLPSNWRSLERRYNEYKGNGPEILIHGGTGNTNTQKIKGEIADFILGTYCLPNKLNTTEVHREYMQARQENNWPSITEDAIYHWLQKPENRKLWFFARHGKAAFINEYGHKVARDKSDWFPNAYLAIDGTKLDWIHFKEGAAYNMGADLKIDVVFDVYSEKIIGYYAGTDHENYTQHFHDIKMALSESGKKPALFTYDNQGGHKTQEMQELYSKVVTSNGGDHYPHRANEHGSPAEQLFKRFQQQVLNKVWWSDKQAVTVRTEDSKPNMEFIKKFRHKLKTVEDCLEALEYYIYKWNASKHPHFEESREKVYSHEETYKLDELDEFEMMRLFWVTSKDPLTYTSSGITPTIRKEKHHFEVYDLDGNVDLDFRDKYIGAKFYYQYDPNQLDNYIRLHLKLPNGDTKYIADAQPIKKVKSLSATMDQHDQNRKHKMLNVRDEDLKRVEQKLEALRHRTNITEESLIEDQELELKYRGKVPKEKRTLAEAGPGSWVNKL